MRSRLVAVLCLAATSLHAQAAPAPAPSATPAAPAPAKLPTIATKAAGLARQPGFVPIIHNAAQAQLWLELPAAGQRMLLCVTLAAGMGSNPVGLDRGANGGCDVAEARRVGPRVLLTLENWNYRSTFPDNPAHARSVAEAFATSTVAALPVIAEEGDRLLVDATDFVLRDWYDIAGTLRRTNQGTWTLAKDRSAVHEPSTKAFPRNTELEASLTFESSQPGPIAQRIAPDGRALTLRQHLALAELPDAGYRPREADPRMSFFGPRFKDYAQPVDRPLERRWIARHRLERADPRDPSSPIRTPITYYIDRGIPEPLRTATLEGARFWEQAFDRAGLKGGFRAELLPEGADPMDLRYNVVQWVNRNERGWSIGGALSDPRTGQILKGMARMDSHRGRTAYNLVAALLGAETAADTAFVLGRVRQVTAHEIGHTLGMAHNYIASSYGRGSVMDYPAPRLAVDASGRIDASRAYDVGPGAFDVLAVRWGYGIFPPEHEADSLAAIVREGLSRGLLFLSDDDARPDGSSDPRVALWDDRATAEEFLRAQMAVRRAAIARFGLGNLRAGEPVATLQERFAPLYYFHRFAVRLLARAVGGVEYHNAVSGDGQQATRAVPAARQRAALQQVLGTLATDELAIPDTVLTLLGPRPFGYEGSVELFPGRTDPQFDAVSAAQSLASLVLEQLLQHERLARVAQQGMRDASLPGLPEVLGAVRKAAWAPAPSGTATGRAAQLARAVQRAHVHRLLALAADKDAADEVRALVDDQLTTLGTELTQRAARPGLAPEERAHARALAALVRRWHEEGELPPMTPLPPPPGDPFGDDES
ncbi:MAG: zinc-dependent metalloprotease [Gemmatimonadales bacterium]|nr:zinc-dependent metalloprotease [Gemmatimonadales bacterium]